MAQDNRQQIDYWNDRAGATWAELQDRLDQLLAPLSAAALAVANVQAGEHVLDVGCGCGDTSIELVRSGALVQGVDVSEPMLNRARSRSSEVEFILADAASFAGPQPYDLVFSRFGVMFFDDPVAAFCNLHRNLCPSGRVSFVCWQPPNKNPWMSVTGRAVAPFLPEPDSPPDPKAPGPFAFADDDYVTTILQDSGFKNIQLQSFESMLKVGNDADQAIQLQTRVGPAARVIAELDGETRAQALAAGREALAEHAGNNGIELGAAVWLVSATAS